MERGEDGEPQSSDDLEELRDDVRSKLYANDLWHNLGIEDPEDIAPYLAQMTYAELQDIDWRIDEYLPVSSDSDEESDDGPADIASSSSDEREYSSDGDLPFFDDDDSSSYEGSVDGDSCSSLGDGDGDVDSELDQEMQEDDYDSSSAEAFSDDEAGPGPDVESPPRTWTVVGRKSKKQALSEKMSALVQARWAKARAEQGAVRRVERAKFQTVDSAALAVLLFGARVSQLSDVMRFAGVSWPCRTTLHSRLKVVAREIVEYGHRRLNREYSKVPFGSTAEIDGAWAHCRRSTQHTMPLICAETGKIVMLKITTQTQRGEKRINYEGDFHGTSQGMEGYALQKIAHAEAKRRGGSRFSRLVTDMQTSVASICKAARWRVELVVDSGHVMRAVRRKIELFSGYVPAGRRNRKMVLRGIAAPIASWFYDTATKAIEPKAKEERLLGIVAHYQREASTWAHKNDPLAVELLSRLARELLPYLARFQTQFNTQACESYNAVKANLADKGHSWKCTFDARSMIGALRWNDAFEWVQEFCDEYGIDLDLETVEWLHEESTRILQRRVERRTDRARHDRNAERNQRTQRLNAVARERRGKELPYAAQTVVEAEDHDVSRALRKHVKRAPNRFAVGDPRISTARLVGIVNSNGTLCHFNADLQMLLALPELSTLNGTQIISRRETSQAWSEFLLYYHAQADDSVIRTDELRKILVQTDEFRGGGRAYSRGREGNWFSKFQNPSETFSRLVDVFGDVRFRGGDGSEWSFRDVFQFTVLDELLSPGGPRAACRPLAGGGLRNGTFICAQPYNVPRAGAIDGTWLLETPTVAGGSICDSVCGRCGSIHAFSSVTRFVGLPPVLAIDFGACLPSLGKRRTPRFEPVHAPLQISVPLGADGLRADYELASFVELKDSHCIAYVRIGPNSFVAYDDGCGSYATLPMATEQISGFISLAFYRS